MTRWPDEAYEAAAFDVGLAALELLTHEHRWVHRRVETVDLLRRELARRQVTVEFTLPPDLRDDLRIGADGPWCVPIAVLQKSPLRHFDLREEGKPVPVLGRDRNGPVAAALLAGSAALALDADALPRAVEQRLQRIATGDPGPAVEALDELLADADEDAVTAAVLDDPTTGYFVATLAESYLLFALLAAPGGRRILKYAYDDPLAFSAGPATRPARLAQSLGWRPVLVDVPVPAALHGPSYHAEVVLPEELRLDAFIVDAQSGRLLSTGVEVAVDRASLHAPLVPADADPVLVTAISAERSGTPTVAASIALVTALVLTLGAAVGDLATATAGSSSAVVLAGSALFAGVVARGGEHRLVRDVFLGARLMLVVVALAALAAAASIAFGASGGVRDAIWLAGAAASWIASVALALAFLRAEPLRRRRLPSGGAGTLSP
jgi:hypothetical protein